MTTFQIREDTTDPVSITLKSEGENANITGYASVKLFMTSRDGLDTISYSDSSEITVVDAATGSLTVKFADGDLLHSKLKYTGYIVVVDGSGNRSTFPEGEDFTFVVGERYSIDT